MKPSPDGRRADKQVERKEAGHESVWGKIFCIVREALLLQTETGTVRLEDERRETRLR